MNISSISFGKETSNKEINKEALKIPEYIKASNRPNYSRVYVRPYNNRDSFINSKQKNNKKPPEKKSKVLIPMPLKTFIAGAVAALCVQNAVVSQNQPTAVTVPIDSETSIEQLAQLYNSDADFITAYNNYDETESISSSDEIKIPSKYSYVTDEINKLTDKLYSSNLSDEKRDTIEEEINSLYQQQELQDKIADVYSDGKYVYFKINIDENDDNPEFLQYGVNVEAFKDIFGIKDNSIRENNDIKYYWDSNEYGGFKNYTRNLLVNGTIIRVPKSDISLKNIDFNFSKEIAAD